METEIRQVIYEHTLSASSLNSGNVFWGEAPQELTGVYCVLSLVTNLAYRDSATKFEEVYFQVSLFGENLLSLETLETEILTLWDAPSATLDNRFTNFTVRGLFRLNRSSLKIEDYWHNILQFKLDLEAI